MLSKPTGLIAFLFLASSLAARPQTDKSEALKLLDKVSKRYADATSYALRRSKNRASPPSSTLLGTRRCSRPNRLAGTVIASKDDLLRARES